MACATVATSACISSGMRMTSRSRAALARVYSDNAGLSRERAGEVAEFLQRAL